MSFRASLSKAGAAATVDAVFEAIQDAPARGEPIAITGFGTFATTSRDPYWEDSEDGREHRHRRRDGPLLQGRQDPARRGSLALRGADDGKLPGPAGGMRTGAVPGVGMDRLPAARRSGITVGVRPANAVFATVTRSGGDRCLPAPERRER